MKLHVQVMTRMKAQKQKAESHKGVRIKPAAHERTCRAYLLFVTSWIDKISSCAGNIYGIFVIRDM
jgi:hypothetical protein